MLACNYIPHHWASRDSSLDSGYSPSVQDQDTASIIYQYKKITADQTISASAISVDSYDLVSGEPAAQNEFVYKLLVLGDPNVGKSSYLRMYVHEIYSGDYKPTMGVDFALKVIRWSEKILIKLQLWDIAGQDRFHSMTRVYYRDAHACIVIFDLTQRETFYNAAKWKRDLDSKCCQPDGAKIPCILLANKSDLSQWEVSQDEIERLCHEENFFGWTEISVKEGLMVEESINYLLEEMILRYGDRQHAYSNSFAEDYLAKGKIKVSTENIKEKDDSSSSSNCCLK